MVEVPLQGMAFHFSKKTFVKKICFPPELRALDPPSPRQGAVTSLSVL